VELSGPHVAEERTTSESPQSLPSETARAVIENVQPEIDCGRFAIKRVAGDVVSVEADVFSDGHDRVAAELLHRPEGQAWSGVRMDPIGNDRFRGSFRVETLGRHFYTVRAWIDRFGTWAEDLQKRLRARQNVEVDLHIGASLVSQAAARADSDASRLAAFARSLEQADDAARSLAVSEELAELMKRHPDRARGTTHARELAVVVDVERARFGAWYEMFPRSTASAPGRIGSFRDCERLLPYVASMGFDVLYFPPIHPIGRVHRKGKNNTVQASPGDPGSPWAVGGPEGGHKAVHPDLGTLEDFRRLLGRAREQNLEIALDLAFQCTPDHPYVREHPDWFRRRPDGSIQYAENPPKKYEDIYPLDFETADWRGLWEELRSVVAFWIEQGVRIFRVDNPHTKPLAFWEWLIADVKRTRPETIFLAEAFTRPRMMYRLAKAGFTQSYTYFAWRRTPGEIAAYFRELTSPPVCEYFRPNLWPNTPDILTEELQLGGRPVFLARLILAAMLGPSYGVYGPAFETYESRAREPGSEEYLDSEKYEVRYWDRERADSLGETIARVNRIRRENPALQSHGHLSFHATDNPQLLCFSKRTEDHGNVIVVCVSVDSHHRQSGWMDLDLDELNLPATESFQVHELLTDARYLWHGRRNYVDLDPRVVPAHIFRVRRRLRTERDFDYYL